MLAGTTSSEKLKRASKQDPATDVLLEHATALLNTLVQSDNPKRLRANVKALVADYVRLNVVTNALTGEKLDKTSPNRGISAWLNPEVLQSLADDPSESLSKKDREIILDVTKSLAFVEELLADTPKENRTFLAEAFVDGFWAVQKMTMCLSAVVSVSDGTMTPNKDKALHWICLAMQDYFNEWNTALMAHNPELHRRMWKDPENTRSLTEDELDEFLGL